MNSPVLKIELKTSSRSWRLMGLITFHCAILALIFCTYTMIAYNDNYRMGGIDVSSLLGLYYGLISFVIIMIGFIAPATTAASIAGEKQRRTFDLLICTRLSSLEIVLGKLSAGLVKSIMLLIVSFPMMALISIFGGISISKIALSFVFILNLAIYFGAIGIFASSIMKRPISATIVSYVIMVVTAFGVPIFTALMVEGLMQNSVGQYDFLYTLFYMSPLSGFLSMLDYQVGMGVNMVSYNIIPMFPLRDFYINGAFNLIVSTVLVLLTSRNISRVGKKDKVSKKKLKKKNKKIG